MSASSLPSARPPSAAIAWVYKKEIFVEIPSKTGVPYVARYPQSAGGLAKALNLIIENPADAPPPAQKVTRVVKGVTARPDPYSPAQREAVRQVLANLRIKPSK